MAWLPTGVVEAVGRAIGHRSLGALPATLLWELDEQTDPALCSEEFANDENWGIALAEIEADYQIRLERLHQAWDRFNWLTVGDALSDLRRLGVLDARHRFVPGVLPEDVIQMTAAELADEARQRWWAEFEPYARRIVDLLCPTSKIRPSGLWMTIEDLASTLEVCADTARAALDVLTKRAGFATSAALDTIGSDEPFLLTVEWGLQTLHLHAHCA